MKLYGFGQSRSFRALWALEESGLQYEYVPIVFGSDENPSGSRGTDYLAINSQGKVPTLIDGSLRLTESGAIVNHIGRRAADSGLLPAGSPEAVARYEDILCFVLSDLEQPLWSNGKHRFALPEEQRVPQMLETANWEFAKAQKALHVYLNGSDFAIGNQFSAADIFIAHTINWAERFKFDVDPAFLGYPDRHYARPAALRAMELIQ